MEENIDDLLKKAKKRYAELPIGAHIKEDFLKQLKTLSQYYDEPMDYPEVENVNFPESIYIAFAVCHPECGEQGFIVEGSSQRCRCGATMFRIESKEYFLKKE